MTTRPGFVWDNAASEWVTIGPVALPGSTVFYQASAPSSPATGDIWIDSDDDVPSIDSSVFYRWKETAAGGETTLSGNDDNGLALKYTPGYEELYINGVLQVRGSDYVATTGTTITGLTALVAGDIVTVMSQVAYTVGDTYTQGAADAKFVSKNVGGLNLVVPTSVTGGTVSANGQVSIGTAVSSVTVNGVFSSAYENYLIQVTGNSGSTGGAAYFITINGSTGTTYQSAGYYIDYGTATLNPVAGALNANGFRCGEVQGTGNNSFSITIYRPFTTTLSSATSQGQNETGGYWYSSKDTNAASSTGFTFRVSSGTITSGTIRIYGYNNGA